MPLLSRDQAQRRADDIQAFYREVERLHEEQALRLSAEQIDQLGEHHRQLLADYRNSFDIDPDAQARRLSLGMRIASLLGALALAASLLFFFYQFWGLFPETAQVGILAGFSVGVVERARLIKGNRVTKGDVLVAVASSGLHSNGFSLARRVLLDEMKLDYGARPKELGTTLGQALLTPTRPSLWQRLVRWLRRDN